MHKNPKLENIEGRPKTADKNEYLALVFAAVNISRGSERSIEEHISKVAMTLGLARKRLRIYVLDFYEREEFQLNIAI